MRRLAWMLVLAGCAPQLNAAEVASLVRASAGGAEGFLRIVGTARIVGLGFPVAGASSVPGLMERGMLANLIEAGFSGLALDVDATAARGLDAYVGGGAVDIDAALGALGEPGLATTELRATLAWMRTYNAADGGRPRRLRVFGLDPRDAEAAMAVVLGYLERVDPAYVPEARSLLRGDQLAIDTVVERLDERREAYGASGAAAFIDARQQAEVVAQARRMAETWEFEAREFTRARNAEWALAQLNGGKLIVVAHNRHIAAEVPGAAPSMGNFLRQWLGAEYRPIAASYAGGQVRGEGCSVVAVTTEPGSLDAALAAGGAGHTLVDLRGQRGALARPQRLRDETLRPAVAFDAIWTIGQVTPATPLGDRCTRSE
jgi:erythromycin esterase-like protein